MSSNEDEPGNASGSVKKRKTVQRACDTCRRKKSGLFLGLFLARRLIYLIQFDVSLEPFQRRGPHESAGDGITLPSTRCSNCTTYNTECTYVEAAKVSFFSMHPAQTSCLNRNEVHRRGILCSYTL